MKIDAYVRKEWSRGNWWSFHPWPALELKWLSGNRSLQAELRWLLWELWVGVFWPPKVAPLPPLDSVHRYDPDFGEDENACASCGAEYAEPWHLRPKDDRVWSMPQIGPHAVYSMMIPGSFTALARSAWAADPLALLYEEDRWPGFVFIETKGDWRALRRSMESQRPIGVLVHVVGVSRAEQDALHAEIMDAYLKPLVMAKEGM